MKNDIAIAYPDHNLHIECDYLLESSHGRVTGQLRINVPSANGSYHTFQVPHDFAFTTLRDRRELVETCHSRNAALDWTFLVDDICERVITFVRSQHHEVEIDTAAIIPQPIIYDLYPFVPRGQPTIIFGEKGSGKSTLCLLMALTLASGFAGCPWFDNVSDEPVRVAWLDWETDQSGFEFDCLRLIEGNGIPHSRNIVYRHCAGQSLVGQIQQIVKLINSQRIGVVIIDSIAPAAGGDLKAQGAIELFQAVGRLGITAVLIGHPPKRSDGDSSVTGAGQFEDLARNVWEIMYEDKQGEDRGYQALRHRKSYKSAYLPARGYEYAYSDAAITIVPAAAQQVTKFVATSPHLLVLELLKGGPMTSRQLQAATGRKATYISLLLNRLKRQNVIVQLPGRLWALAAYNTIGDNK